MRALIRVVVAVVLVGVGVLGWVLPSVAQDAPAATAAEPKAAITLVGPGKPVLRVKDGKPRKAAVTVFGRSTSAADATVRFLLIVPESPPIAAPQEPKFSPSSTSAVTVTFSLPNGLGLPRAALLEARSTTPGQATLPPASVELTTAREARSLSFLAPFFIGLGGAFLVGLVMAGIALLGPGKVIDEVRVTDAWKFNDSWATNLVVVGAVAGGFLTGAGVLTDLVPGLETGRFTALVLMFGAMALAAPVIYTALGKRKVVAATTTPPAPASWWVVGTAGGLLVSTTTVLWGVFGQLATIGAVVSLTEGSDAGKWTIYGLLGITGAFVAAYACRTTWWLTRAPQSGTVYKGSALI